MTREWILQTLEELPVWCWPIFLWDLMRIRAWLDANPAETEEILIFGVLSNGRIIMTCHIKADRPDHADWAQLSPRAPWDKLMLDARPCAPLLRRHSLSAYEDCTHRTALHIRFTGFGSAQPFFDTG